MKKRNVLLAAIAAAAAAVSAALGLRTLREAVAKKSVADREVADRTGAQKAPPAGRRGPARQYTDEERKERHRLAQLAYYLHSKKTGNQAPD